MGTIGVTVRDLDASVRFYTDVLQFRVLERRHAHGADDCQGCPLTGRRDFLRDALAAVAGVAAALAIPSMAQALPLGFTSPTGRAGAARAYPIPAADGVEIDRDEEVILVRWKNAVYAFALSCPHQNTALRWQAAESRFQCPKHKSRYQPDGTFIEGRATRPMDRLGVRRAGDTVVVDTGALHKQPDDPAAYAAAVVRLA